MVIERGQIWWADLGEPRGSSPGFERPVLVVQSDFFNQTNINTVVVAIITTTLRLSEMPGNVLISPKASGLSDESVVNVTQLFTVDKDALYAFVGTLSERKMEQIEKGLRLVLSL